MSSPKKRPSKHKLRNSRNLIKQLKLEGWACVRSKGSHQRYINPDKPENKLTVPHPIRALPEGTLRNIYRQAGWAWN